MRFSIRCNNDLPVATYPRLAQDAEAAGFDQFWVSDDLFLRGAWPILSACAIATQRIHIGTCIVNPYTIHPAEIAMQAAALDELSNGRFNLGLAAGAADFLGWVGLEQRQPLALIEETFHVLRALFAGERGAFTGHALHGWTNEAYLRFPTRQIPLYLGAMSPKMLTLIGQIADGGLPLLFPPEHYAEVREYVQQGTIAAGRAFESLDLVACIWVSVAEDRDAARDALRAKIAYYGHALSPTIRQHLGLTHADFDEIARIVQTEHDITRAKALITDQMLRIGVVGNGRDIIERLETLVALGANHLSFGPPLGPDPFAAIQVLGREVLPYFRSM